MQIVINGNRTKNKNDKANATARLREIISDAQHSMDLPFAAGTLATTANIAHSDAVQYAEKLNDEDHKKAVEDANSWLKPTVKKISEIELNDCEYLKHWLGEDEKAFSNTKEFFHQAKKELKRSFILTKTQAANPRWLGVKPRKTKYLAKAYPTLPAMLEDSVES